MFRAVLEGVWGCVKGVLEWFWGCLEGFWRGFVDV